MKIGKIEVVKLLEVIKPLNELCVEMDLYFNNIGLNIIEMCPANVSLININIKKENFIVYNVETELKVGINVKTFLDNIKDFKKEVVSLEVENDFLHLDYSNGLKSKIPLIEREQEKTKMPEVNGYNHNIILDSKEFKGFINHFKSNFESINFIVKNDLFTLNSKTDLSNSEIEVKSKIETLIESESKSKFSLEYLSKIFKYSLSSETELKVGNDLPLFIVFNKGNTEIKVYLAPRVENE